jgi:hypothetical protein
MMAGVTDVRPPLVARGPHAPPRDPPDDAEQRELIREHLLRTVVAPNKALVFGVAAVLTVPCLPFAGVLGAAALIHGRSQLRLADWYAGYFQPGGPPHRGRIRLGAVLGAVALVLSLALTVVMMAAGHVR